MRLFEFLLIGFLLVFSLTQTGCSGINRRLKSWFGGSSVEQNKQANNLTKFSDSPEAPPRVRRQYKRTTKESLADESALDSKSGSLWVMEGQGAYLFSQNIVRLVGDPLAITIEGDPRDQLQSKVSVIQKLLAKIEERQKARLRNPSSEDDNSDSAKEKSKDEDTDAAKEKAKEKEKKTAQEKQNQQQPPPELSVKTVPTRIVERTLEGNYRVKGTQPFLIGAREYKLIVTGVVRAEDFNEEGISATKLLDSKFDIVSARRKEAEL